MSKPMIRIPGYHITNERCSANGRVYYDGERISDGRPVIVKTILPGPTAPMAQVRLRHEYDLLMGLECEGVANPYALEAYPNGLALILEYIEGLTLSEYISTQKLDLPTFLKIAISISEVIGELHRHHVIHKDIQSDNIFFNSKTHQIWLIDFRFTTVLPKEKPHILNPDAIEGGLAYMSPEQTGRMNRALDHRTDFYSLGVLFYQILIGHLPFESNDPLEIVHSHLAKQPALPSDINPKIPVAISDIIMKLLSKNAEARYQSSHGLIEDLKKCSLQLEKIGNIESFKIGKKDFPEQFQISQKIYGRKNETGMLLKIFERASLGSMEMMVISGNPGIGKTSLVQEIQIPVTSKNAFFIKGKFDPFYRNVPYSALVYAFQQLIRQLLSQSEKELNAWKEKLMAVLGQYGRIVTDLIPEVAFIIGEQPPIKKMESSEFQNLVNRIKMNFIRVFTSPEHPLVIFLDDLQWVDTPTLKLIEEMAAEEGMQHVFLIISYRDNEVDQSHPLSATLKNLENKHCALNRISISPLGLEDIVQLTADTFNVVQRSVATLAELVLRKTGGNPFFISQFLMTLYQENLIYLNNKDGFWEWDFQAIEQLDFTDNIVDLLVQRLALMPKDTRLILIMASCIGSQFDLKVLRTISDYSDLELVRHLLPAIREDLLETSSDSASDASEKEAMTILPRTFRFRHDRIRQACYSLISDENKQSSHLKIGRLLLDDINSFHKDEELFDIIYHLNIGAGLIDGQQECDELAELNLVVGIRAMAMGAFEPAYRYFQAGIRLLDEKVWTRQYSLALKIYSQCAESSRLCGKFEKTQNFFDIILKNSRTMLDRVDIYETQILFLISEDRRLEALDMSRIFLQDLGIDLPEQPTADYVRHILEKTIAEFSGVTVEGLEDIHEMTDPSKLAAMKIMRSMISAVYTMFNDWLVIFICQQIKLSFRSGLCSYSAYAFCGLGLIICGKTGDIETGHRFGRIGLELLNRFRDEGQEVESPIAFHAFINPCKFHLKESLEPLLSLYYTGQEIGKYEYSIYASFYYNVYSFLCGQSIADIENQMVRFIDDVRRKKQLHSETYFSIIHQMMTNLLGKNETPWELSGSFFDENKTGPILKNSNNTYALYYMYFCKFLLCFHFGIFTDAISHAEQLEGLSDHVPGDAGVPVCCFFESLSRLAVYDTLSEDEKSLALDKVNANQVKMKNWMEHAPANHAHRFFLVDAELARVLGKFDQAVTGFDKAIRLAQENNYINDEALSYELAAKFMLKREQLEFSEIFMNKAYVSYFKWGATRKAEHLYAQYPNIIKPLQNAAHHLDDWISTDEKYPNELSQDGLDLATLMKASQAIASEIELDKLLTKMMRIVIETTGAEVGFLLLNIDGRLWVSAKGYVESGKVLTQSIDPVDMEAEALSPAVVRYVARIRESLVLHNAVENAQFANEPYIRKYRPKSVLSIPIIYKNKLTGAIYLENRMTPDVFSSDRIELLNLLSSQIAISLENTMLFENQKKAEEKYRGIFENAVEGIFVSTTAGRFVSVNPATAQILGYESSEELLEKINNISSQLYVLPDEREKFLRLLRKNEKIENFQTQFHRKDGTRIWVSLNARPRFNENGELDLIEGFLVDITELKAVWEAQQLREEQLRKENIRLRSDIRDRYKFGSIIGKSAAMQQVYELIVKAAATNAAVIIYGESGTGKELVAKAIHDTSERQAGNFVAVNCGAIPENLQESEFFGYKKGAFTGANTDKNGYLDLGNGGTLFLDELGEISLNFQVKLLRVLEDGSYAPLGDRKTKKTNARVVAATSRDLQEAIRNGRMREDFFYRIHVIPIHLPPLRERVEDIPLLVEHFLKTLSDGDKAPPVSAKIMEELCAHTWSGNVRELQNVLQRFCTLGTLDFFSGSKNISALPGLSPHKEKTDSADQTYRMTIAETEKMMIVEALERYKWNRSKAASHLGIPRRTFYRKLEKYQLV